MNDEMLGKRLRTAMALMFLTVFAPGLFAQAGPDVMHSGIECIPQTEFALLTASIRPGEEIQMARVYFRSNMYPDFYYVDMTGTDEAFQAILPKPSPETAQVIYYIEAVDVGFSSNRTHDHSFSVDAGAERLQGKCSADERSPVCGSILSIAMAQLCL